MSSYVVTGTLSEGRTVTLDEALPLEGQRGRVLVEPLTPRKRRPHGEVLAEIRERQRARGHVPPTKEEVDAYIREERASWGD